MNTKEWAEKLNGREYCNEITREEERQAKEDGIVIVYGASDDLMEFGGAIHDEVGAYDGGTAFVSPEGLFNIDKECPEGGRYTIDDCSFLRGKRDSCVPIEAVWEPESMDGASWLMEAPEHLSHEHFDIMEDGALYCRGLVFRLADAVLPGSDTGHDSERAWECAMMAAIGEDGPKSVTEAIAKLKAERDELLTALEALANEYREALDLEYSTDAPLEQIARALAVVSRIKGGSKG